MRWVMLILLLCQGAVWAQSCPSPEPSGRPHPVLCQVVVRVVQAGTGEPLAGVLVSMLTARLTTAEDGTARFNQVPNHPLQVVVGSGGDVRRVQVVPNPKAAVEVTVSLHMFVSVLISAVTDGDNNGVAGAYVNIDDKPAGTTDDRGLLSIRLPAGSHRIRLMHPSYVFVPSVLSTSVTLQNSEALSFVGRPITGRLRVQVVARGPNGDQPVVGASVQVQTPGGGQTLLTGVDGTALSDPLVVGHYLIRVHAEGMSFPSEARPVVLSAPGEVWVTVLGQPVLAVPGFPSRAPDPQER